MQDFVDLEVSVRDSVAEIDQLTNKTVPPTIDKCQTNTHVRQEETYVKTPISSVQSSQTSSQQTRSDIITVSSEKSSTQIMSTAASNKEPAKSKQPREKETQLKKLETDLTQTPTTSVQSSQMSSQQTRSDIITVSSGKSLTSIMSTAASIKRACYD